MSSFRSTRETPAWDRQAFNLDEKDDRASSIVSNDRLVTELPMSTLKIDKGQRAVQSYDGQTSSVKSDSFSESSRSDTPKHVFNAAADPFTKSEAPNASKAKMLAEFIKSGGLTTSSNNSNGGVPHVIRPSGIPYIPRGQMLAASNFPIPLPVFPGTTEFSTGFFDILNQQGYLTYEQACNNVPFIESARLARPSHAGVARITNIPYSTTKPEIVAFVGRNARLVQQPPKSPFWGIHIIMERATAKTMNCFVEFESPTEAGHAVARIKNRCSTLRPARIGDRLVDVEVSTQEELMAELFPRAKCVKWQGQVPQIVGPNDQYSSGFKGFVTNEEMVMTVKHAEAPQRSPFTSKCYQRVYESMISILYKYPWWAVESYTLGERDSIFKTTLQLVNALINHMRRGTDRNRLTTSLMLELVCAALHCPGFTEAMKFSIIQAAMQLPPVQTSMNPSSALQYVEPFPQPMTHPDILPLQVAWWSQSLIGRGWAFECLNRLPNVGEDVLMYYAAMIQHGTQIISSANQFFGTEHSSRTTGALSSPFGDLTVSWPQEKDKLSIAAAAQFEWAALQRVFAAVLPGSPTSDWC